MSKIIKIEVNQATVDYVQSLDYQVSNRKSLLLDIAKELGVSSEPFKEYEKEYLEYSNMYNLLKVELESIFVPEDLRSHDTTWRLEYRTNLLTIEIKCKCGIDLIESGKVKFVSDNFNDGIVENFEKNKVE